MNFRFLILLIILPIVLIGQSKQDYHWVFGGLRLDNEDSIVSLTFDFNQPFFEVGLRPGGLSFDQNNVSISDTEGNLLFYTNGCAIAGADHNIMMNGDSINAGNYFDELWLGDCSFGYPGVQDVMILKDPAKEDGFFVIHKTREYEPGNNPSTYLRYIKYTYVDMSLNQGKGAVLLKNEIFFDSGINGILWSYLSAIQHENQKDWWIINPLKEENAYLTILLTENGFEKIDTQNITRPQDDFGSSAGGNARFSPDGNNYVYYNKYDGLHVFDFDRSDGRLSNSRSLETVRPESAQFSSVEFSSNSQLLYYMTHDSLWQVDLTYNNLEDGKMFIAEWNGIQDPFATTFFDAALAPDCRIYIRSGSSTQSVHVINHPNEKGLACEFVQQGIKFPFTNSTGSWPNFPRSRVDEEDKCDSTIVSIFGELVYYRQDLKAYPIPTVGPITIEIPENYRSGYLKIVSNEGQIVMEKKVDHNGKTISIDLSNYPAGIYHIEYLPKDNTERKVFTRQIVISN